jgi:hypothetical protein
MILDIDLQTFQEVRNLKNEHAFYVESEDSFILIQGLDGLILRSIVNKAVLTENLKASMAQNASNAAQDAGLQVDSMAQLPPEEEIAAQASETFKRENLEGMRQAQGIVQPEVSIRL